MNQSFIAPASVRPNAVALAKQLRRGLLLSGATGMTLSLATAPVLAQSLPGKSASASPVASNAKAAQAALKKAKLQEQTGSVALAAVFYREALNQDQYNPAVARELARFYVRQNRVEEATTEWKRVAILTGKDAEATRELARLARLISVTPRTVSTGAANVGPLPQVVSPRTQTRVVARQTAKVSLPPIGKTSGRVLMAQNSDVVGPLPDAPVADAPMDEGALPLPAAPSTSGAPTTAAPTTATPAPAPAAPAPAPAPTQPRPNASRPVANSVPRAQLASLPADTRISPTPFSLPARTAVVVSKKNRAAAWPYVNAGAKFLKDKKTNRALLEYQRGAELDPTNPYALPGVAVSQIILGDFNAAAATYRRFLGIRFNPDPKVPAAETTNKALRGLADSLTYAKRYREALGVNSFILSRNPNDFDAAYQSARIYSFAGSYNAAYAAFQRAYDLNPNRSDLLVDWGEALSYRRNPGATSVLLRALQQQPGNARATLALANSYLYSNQLPQASTRYKEVLKAEPNNITALVSLGDVFSYLGRPNDAIPYYKRALAQQPRNAKANQGLGVALVYAGKYREGARVLNPIVSANRSNVAAYEALALAQAETGSPNAARSYTELLKIQSDPRARARSFAALGDLRLKGTNSGDTSPAVVQAAISDATQYYAQAVQLDPNNFKTSLFYAQLLSYSPTPPWQQVDTYATRALTLQRNASNSQERNNADLRAQAQALQVLSRLRVAQGTDPQTIDRAQVARVATEFQGQIQNLKLKTAEESLALAQAFYSLGRGSENQTPGTEGYIADDPILVPAAKRLLLVAASQVDRPETAVRLANATRDVGDYPTSIALFQRILQLYPNNNDARLGYVKTLFYSDNLQQAATEAKSLVAITPNSTEAQLLAAQINMRLNTPEARDNAVQLAEAILAREPQNGDALLIQGQGLASRARYAEAVTRLQAAVQADPDNLISRLELARNLNFSRDTENSILQYRELIRLAPADITPRLELAQILLDRSRYTEAEELYNQVVMARENIALLPDVRRAIASGTLRRIPRVALRTGVRSNALVVPRASKRRVVVNNPLPVKPTLANPGHRRLAQNPGTTTDPTAGVLPQTSTTTPGVETLPSTPLEGTGTGTEVAPPFQNAPTTPDTTTPDANTPVATPPDTTTPDTTTPDANTPVATPPDTTTPDATTTAPPATNTEPTPNDTAPVATGTNSSPPVAATPGPLGSVDSPVKTPLADLGAAYRGLGESQRRQGRFTESERFFRLAIERNKDDYAARLGLAQALRGQRQFAQASEEVQAIVAVDANSLTPNLREPLVLVQRNARVLQAQLLSDTGQPAEARAQLDTLVNELAQIPADSPSRAESYTQVVLGLNAVGNYTQSLTVLDTAIGLFPTEPSFQRLRAQTLGLAGQTDNAVAAYDALLAADSRDSEALLGKARVLNYSNRLAESEAVYRQALDQGRNDPRTQAELADVLGRRRNFTEATALYQTAIQADPNNLAVRVDLARMQRAQGQSAEAEATLNAVLDVRPDYADALVERGLVRGTGGNYSAGIADLNSALAKDPTNPNAQLGLAQVQSYAKQYTESIASYRAFLDKNPDNALARVELAQTLSYAGQSEAALTELDTARTKIPATESTLLAREQLVRAGIYSRTNRATEATAIYNSLLASDTQNGEARLGLADSLLYARRYDEAIRVYDQIPTTDPSYGLSRISRARALSYAGRANEAVTALRAIVAADSTNLDARLALAEAGANSGNATLQRDAIGEYNAILKDNPDNVTAQLGLARVLSYRGNYSEAEAAANTILASDPKNAEALVIRADARRFAGNPFSARSDYKEAASIGAPNAAVAQSIKTGLITTNRATSPSVGASFFHYDDSNDVRLNSFGATGVLRFKPLTIGAIVERGRFRQGNLPERDRNTVGLLLARRFGAFTAQLIVSQLKYSGLDSKTLYNLDIRRDFNARKRIALNIAKRDIYETNLAVTRGITANIINGSFAVPLGKRFDLEAAATYYRYSDDNSRITLAPSLMFRFKPTNPTLRIGIGGLYDDTEEARNAPFVYYTPQSFNSAAILADYIVATGSTRYGISAAVPVTGSTGLNGINRPADTLFGFLERDLGGSADFFVRGGIVRARGGVFDSNQVSTGFNLYF